MDVQNPHNLLMYSVSYKIRDNLSLGHVYLPNPLNEQDVT